MIITLSFRDIYITSEKGRSQITVLSVAITVWHYTF